MQNYHLCKDFTNHNRSQKPFSRKLRAQKRYKSQAKRNLGDS